MPSTSTTDADPDRLPIWDLHSDLMSSLESGGVAVVQAPTGSGKSTQIPQWLMDWIPPEKGEVIVLQPRRLAARMLAKRVAWERGEALGKSVGYQVRFENCAGPETRLRFVTEGILLRRILGDPDLRGVAALVFDEFHERHLYSDLSLALARTLRTRRPDLQIVVMSATLDTARLVSFLEPCVRLTSSGRTFPVDIRYLERNPGERDQPWDLAVRELEKAAPATDGDALIFMPGAYEIERTVSALRASGTLKGWVIASLHGDLPPERQDEAVRPVPGKRRAIVSTNIAETSLTIDGVRIVVDSGLARVARHDPHRGIDTLLIEKISRASADQRAGRAGRTAPGVCLRLWTSRDDENRPPHETPEIQRVDIAEGALTLKAAGYDDLNTFPWFEAPREAVLERSVWLLTRLGALDLQGRITRLGAEMLTFPVHPRHARLLLESASRGCLEAGCLIAALTQGRGIWNRMEGASGRDKRDKLFGEASQSDWEHALGAFEYARQRDFRLEDCRNAGIHAVGARQVAKLFEQFRRIARHHENPDILQEPDALWKSLLAAFPDFVAARLDEGTLRSALVGGRSGVLARESIVRDARFFVAGEVREIRQRNGDLQVLLCDATAISETWLEELFPASVLREVKVSYDPVKRQVIKTSRLMFEDLPLGKAEYAQATADEAAPVLAAAVREHALVLKGWDEAVEQWIARVNLVAARFPELGVAVIDDSARTMLLEAFCHGAQGYKDIKEKSALSTVRGWLNPALAANVERLAPERVGLPNGKKAKIDYRSSLAPVIEMRIQDLFDVKRGLSIADGRIALTIQVLAPNHRPVQVTSNLSDFWEKTYPEIKSQLQRKYPRHEWR